MFFWLTSFLTFLLFPISLIFMKIPKLVLAKKWLPTQVVKAFPLSSLTVVMLAQPRTWFANYMEKNGVAGFAFLGFVIVRASNSLHNRITIGHEMVHVVHQSCMSPILIGIVYVLDLLVWLPFNKFFCKNAHQKVSVVEKVAYTVMGQDLQLARKVSDPLRKSDF